MKHFLKLSAASLMLLVPSLTHAKGDTVNQQLDIPANARVVIDTMRGQVDIQGGQANVAKVTGTLDKNAEAFVFELNGDTLTIQVKMPKRGNFSNNDGNDLSISLPSTARVEAQSVSADFKVSDFSSSVIVSSVSGDLMAKNLTGGVNVESVSGDIEAHGLAGEITLESVSGDVEDYGSKSTRATYATVSGDIKATTTARVVRAEAVSGDVELKLSSIDSLHANNVSGDVVVITALQPRARVNVETVSGSTMLKLRGELHADIDADASAGGDIVNRLNQVQPKEGTFGLGQSLSLQLGERSGSMNLQTVSGEIVLEKH